MNDITSLDAVLEGLLAIAEDLFEVLRVLGDVETVTHHLLEGVRMMEVEDLTVAIVVLTNVVQQDVDHRRHEVGCFQMSQVNRRN